MALTTSISACIRNACTTLVFRETTGAYNVTTNPTGYGAPNQTTANIVSAVLTVTAPDDTIYTINLFTHSFPSTNVDFEYEIPLSSLGNRTVIEDGYWQFVYTIVDNAGSPVTTIATKTAIFTCNSNCCVNRLLLDIDEYDLDCSTSNKKKIQKYLKAKAFLDSLKHYAYCGNLDMVTNIKLIVDKLCGTSRCASCD